MVGMKRAKRRCLTAGLQLRQLEARPIESLVIQLRLDRLRSNLRWRELSPTWTGNHMNLSPPHGTQRRCVRGQPRPFPLTASPPRPGSPTVPNTAEGQYPAPIPDALCGLLIERAHV